LLFSKSRFNANSSAITQGNGQTAAANATRSSANAANTRPNNSIYSTAESLRGLVNKRHLCTEKRQRTQPRAVTVNDIAHVTIQVQHPVAYDTGSIHNVHSRFNCHNFRHLAHFFSVFDDTKETKKKQVKLN